VLEEWSSRQGHNELKRPGTPTTDKRRPLRIVSLNPEVKGHFGHFLAFEKILARSCAERGIDHLVLGALDADETALRTVHLVPVFDRYTWRPYAAGRFHRFLDLWRCASDFAPRVRRALDQARDGRPATNDILFMYLAHPRHLAAAIKLGLGLRGSTPIILNLFWTHFSLGTPDAQPDRMLTWFLRLTRPVRRILNIHLCADSDILVQRLSDVAGEPFGLLPMFSVTDFSAVEDDLSSFDQAPIPRTRVLYPTGNMRLGKGYDLVCHLARQLQREDIELLIRRPANEFTDPKLLELANEISNATVLDGILTPEEYVRLLQDADVVLIPYRRREFYSRTSGIFADAVYLNKPMVGTADTWLGRQIQKIGCGETFEDGDIAGLGAAVERVVDNLPFYVENAKRAREEWLAENSPSKALEFLLTYSRPRGERATAPRGSTLQTVPED